jgi:hypothetical protein
MNPNYQQVPDPMNVQHSPIVPSPVAPQPKKRWAMWTSIIVVVILLLGAVGFVFRYKIMPSKASTEKLSGYQAVFLTNGQVYFGKVSNPNDQYVKLTSIFYLQTSGGSSSSTNQSDSTAASTANSTDPNAQTQLSLVKLGNELHGPADSMSINRDQILFIEDLKASGQVYQAILKYQATPQTPAASSTSQAPATDGTTAPATGTNAPAAQQQAPATGTPAPQTAPTQQAPTAPTTPTGK